MAQWCYTVYHPFAIHTSLCHCNTVKQYNIKLKCNDVITISMVHKKCINGIMMAQHNLRSTWLVLAKQQHNWMVKIITNRVRTIQWKVNRGRRVIHCSWHGAATYPHSVATSIITVRSWTTTEPLYTGPVHFRSLATTRLVVVQNQYQDRFLL